MTAPDAALPDEGADLPAGYFDDSPKPGAEFTESVRRFFRRYAVFSGRASRSEYWWVILFHTMVLLVGFALAAAFGGIAGAIFGSTSDAPVWAISVVGTAVLLYELFVLVPLLALTVRRLHDANLAGWFLLLGLVPGLALVNIVFTVLPSNPAGQRFDRAVPIPRAEDDAPFYGTGDVLGDGSTTHP